MSGFRMLVLGGDGVGPEVTEQAVRVGRWIAGRNVNELTHQRLTDLGAAPAFYDVLVQVALDATAGAAGGPAT